jgi:hypothetical protein
MLKPKSNKQIKKILKRIQKKYKYQLYKLSKNKDNFNSMKIWQKKKLILSMDVIILIHIPPLDFIPLFIFFIARLNSQGKSHFKKERI